MTKFRFVYAGLIATCIFSFFLITPVYTNSTDVLLGTNAVIGYADSNNKDSKLLDGYHVSILTFIGGTILGIILGYLLHQTIQPKKNNS
jgi:putative flippase GtrA